MSSTQLMCIGLARIQTPLAHRLAGHDDAAFGQQLFRVAVAEGKPILPEAINEKGAL
jgi:hypothetical protein